jgi:hypothetical protein
MSNPDPPAITHLKNQARFIKKDNPALTHSQALEAACKAAGFNNYAHARNVLFPKKKA